MAESKINHVSDTAFLVAYYRGLESQRKDALFKDPYAALLTSEKGKNISGSLDSITKYTYWTMSIRTPLIDELVNRYILSGCKSIINLGAGLDARPYRLDLPKDFTWYELDFPEMINYKSEVLKNEKPNCRLERISVDLSNSSERKRIFSVLNKKVESAFVITEGVIPYLTESNVTELGKDIFAQDNFKFWLTECLSPKSYKRFQNKKFKEKFKSAPFQFMPTDWDQFFKDIHWSKKEQIYLYDVGLKLGRPFPLPWWAKFFVLLINKEKFLENVRVSSYVVLQKMGS